MRLRVLFLADSHLGYDLPTSPRIHRRRRGQDFLANYERALAPALRGEVDLVVHGGDVFDRARVPHTLVYWAFEPLRRLGAAGIPVFVVPGNHELSHMPHQRFTTHPGVHVFDAPRTVRITLGGLRIAVAGFPYHRRDVRAHFRALVDGTGWRAGEADLALLCVHQCFEGATVGPADYMFRSAPNVIRGGDVPTGIAAVLTGHVHRHQQLTKDLAGRPLAALVLYAGSIERTSFAEMGDPKGYLLVELGADGARTGGRIVHSGFRELPARPMVEREVRVAGLDLAAVERRLCAAVQAAPPEAVLRIKLCGRIRGSARAVLTARNLRALAPPLMNVDVILVDEPRSRRTWRSEGSSPR